MGLLTFDRFAVFSASAVAEHSIVLLLWRHTFLACLWWLTLVAVVVRLTPACVGMPFARPVLTLKPFIAALSPSRVSLSLSLSLSVFSAAFLSLSLFFFFLFSPKLDNVFSQFSL